MKKVVDMRYKRRYYNLASKQTGKSHKGRKVVNMKGYLVKVTMGLLGSNNYRQEMSYVKETSAERACDKVARYWNNRQGEAVTDVTVVKEW
jgi:hypothetical protein